MGKDLCVILERHYPKFSFWKCWSISLIASMHKNRSLAPGVGLEPTIYSRGVNICYQRRVLIASNSSGSIVFLFDLYKLNLPFVVSNMKIMQQLENLIFLKRVSTQT